MKKAVNANIIRKLSREISHITQEVLTSTPINTTFHHAKVMNDS